MSYFVGSASRSGDDFPNEWGLGSSQEVDVPFEPLKIRRGPPGNTRGHAPLSPVSSVHHEALSSTTGCLSALCSHLPAPGHDAAQAKPARGEVVVQRRHEGDLLHPGRLGQWQCVDRTPGALLKVLVLFKGVNLSRVQGGGACHDIEECTRRCEEDGVPLCSSKNARDQIQMGGRASVWSPLPEENPAFHDWYKVYFNPLKLLHRKNPGMH